MRVASRLPSAALVVHLGHRPFLFSWFSRLWMVLLDHCHAQPSVADPILRRRWRDLKPCKIACLVWVQLSGT